MAWSRIASVISIGLIAETWVFAMHDHLRRVDHRVVPALPLGMGGPGEFVLPAEIVPVIDVESQGDDVVTVGEFGMDRIGPADRKSSPATYRARRR